jgi:hypothetical protein
LKAANVTAGVRGSGDVTCYATDYLKASVGGSGSIGYKGNPARMDIPKKRVHKL